MNKRVIQLTLPAFCFLEGSGHEVDDSTLGRNIIYHVRSASVIEAIPRQDLLGIEEGVLKYEFTHFNQQLLIAENFVLLLHYCGTLDKDLDRELIINEVMRPAAKWFSDYCDWEDENIAKGKLL